jgi:hypothetical protein
MIRVGKNSGFGIWPTIPFASVATTGPTRLTTFCPWQRVGRNTTRPTCKPFAKVAIVKRPEKKTIPADKYFPFENQKSFGVFNEPFFSGWPFG